MEDKFRAYRKRKKERMEEMERRIKELEAENQRQYHEILQLKSDVYYLETKRR